VAYERRVMRSFNCVLAVSEQDRAALRRLVPELPTALVPNGVDTDYFGPTTMMGTQATAGTQATPYIVFTGTLDFRPNIDALRWFVQQALPLIRARRPQARFVAVGKSPAPAVYALAGAGVEIHGDVPDVRPFIAGAAAYVVPMRMGGGVRLKLLEALAMQAPVVSTSMGAEGVEGLAHGAQLLLADTEQEFAAAVLRLLEDRPLARRLGAAGRRLARARYDWRVIVPALEEAYSTQLVNRKS
jgi:glycosyltransferase involved in cell wall biosynthesis